MAAKPCGASKARARSSRSVVSRIPAMVQPSAPSSAGGSPTCWRFQATRQRAEQNRACSRRGANNVPHCSHFRVSVITFPRPMLRVTAALPGIRRSKARYRRGVTPRPPLPPFTEETARQKVQAAEDAWNTRDPERVAGAYSEDSVWRNRDEFVTGRAQIVEFLRRKWARELDYALRKDPWSFHRNRIAMRCEYESRKPAG